MNETKKSSQHKNAHALMVLGTASNSGKSLISAALCRILWQDQKKVAPFKAQNMSNNSWVTKDRKEMGRAQVVQAAAAGLEPNVLMNPVLLKPSSDMGSQVVLHGEPAFHLDASNWHDSRPALKKEVLKAYDQLASQYDYIILEGAGSPAEINLKQNDIVNLGMAEMADCPAVLVGDIDRGGVFASLYGTIMLLEPHERKRIQGIIINKFRGHAELLTPGLEQLEKLTGVPVLGVVPWLDHHIDEEDGVAATFDRNSLRKAQQQAEEDQTGIDICIVYLPHISNHTDFSPLERIPGVHLRWTRSVETLGNPDLLILPGTKATASDLQKLKRNGLARAIQQFAQAGGMVLGICGGFQMLGHRILDPEQQESSIEQEEGLGLLDLETKFSPGKTMERVNYSFAEGDDIWTEGLESHQFSGYEIHSGLSTFGPASKPFTFSQLEDSEPRLSGIVSENGRIAGTYLHGLLDSNSVVLSLINALRKQKGLSLLVADVKNHDELQDHELNRLADLVRESVDIEKVYDIIHNFR